MYPIYVLLVFPIPKFSLFRSTASRLLVAGQVEKSAPWTLQGQMYPIYMYVLLMSTSPKFHFVSLCEISVGFAQQVAIFKISPI